MTIHQCCCFLVVFLCMDIPVCFTFKWKMWDFALGPTNYIVRVIITINGKILNLLLFSRSFGCLHITVIFPLPFSFPVNFLNDLENSFSSLKTQLKCYLLFDSFVLYTIQHFVCFFNGTLTGYTVSHSIYACFHAFLLDLCLFKR